MSFVFNRLVRVSSSLTTQRPRFYSQSHSYSLLQHVKWCHNQTHYQHGIPGIPTDGKVVLLKNSETGSQIYLVGTWHISKHSAETVKKVIDSVRPNAIAIEESRLGMKELRSKNWGPANVNEAWFSMFLRSMRSPGGLQDKIRELTINWVERHGVIYGGEFKVALEESRRLRVKLVPIDVPRLVRVIIPWHIYLRRIIPCFIQMLKIKSIVHLMDLGSRSQIRQLARLQRIYAPENMELLVDDRDVYMFMKLRVMERKRIVAVVGIGHMDGIERLWKRAEDAGL